MKRAVRPVGLKPAPRRAPQKLRDTDDLRKLQRLMTHVLVRPLTAQDGLQTKWVDGRSMHQVAAEFIKPNDRLSAFDRLQLYNRMYWFRLIDCFYDDNPGLRALLGEKKFSALTRAYLARYPSRSFTLRNLSARLEKFLREQPQWSAPHQKLAREVVRFEWSQTLAFDGESKRVLSAAEIAAIPPQKLRLRLQPYVTLLALNFPVDDFVIAVKKREALRGEASNAVDTLTRRANTEKRIARPLAEKVWIAVHRVDMQLYYKRLEPAAYKILTALRDGRTLLQAVTRAGKHLDPVAVQTWFATWMELGWFWAQE